MVLLSCASILSAEPPLSLWLQWGLLSAVGRSQTTSSFLSKRVFSHSNGFDAVSWLGSAEKFAPRSLCVRSHGCFQVMKEIVGVPSWHLIPEEHIDMHLCFVPLRKGKPFTRNTERWTRCMPIVTNIDLFQTNQLHVFHTNLESGWCWLEGWNSAKKE